MLVLLAVPARSPILLEGEALTLVEGFFISPELLESVLRVRAAEVLVWRMVACKLLKARFLGSMNPAFKDAALRRLSPKSDMARAIAYGTKRWPALCRFLADGRLEIDNNIAERALRGVAVGRRNWLFAGSRTGGERAAAIYTVIQTCKANGVDPQAYIADLIARVAGDWPASRWDELLPWNWSREPARLAA